MHDIKKKAIITTVTSNDTLSINVQNNVSVRAKQWIFLMTGQAQSEQKEDFPEIRNCVDMFNCLSEEDSSVNDSKSISSNSVIEILFS